MDPTSLFVKFYSDIVATFSSLEKDVAQGILQILAVLMALGLISFLRRQQHQIDRTSKGLAQQQDSDATFNTHLVNLRDTVASHATKLNLHDTALMELRSSVNRVYAPSVDKHQFDQLVKMQKDSQVGGER